MKLSAHDQGVMMTSHDALATKYYGAKLKYFQDDYAQLFIKNKRKMYPIINRGTWARVQGYRQVIGRFLEQFGKGNVNIISLGCGYDTTYYSLLQQCPDIRQTLCYVEIDYDIVVNRKIEIIKKNKELYDLVFAGTEGPHKDYEIELPKYKLFAHDVR